MRAYSAAQGPLLNALGDLNGKEIQKKRGMCIRMTDSRFLCCTVETNTLYDNYVLIKINQK